MAHGLSKVWGESLSRFYWDRFGIETVCIRIGDCFPELETHRQMVTWLSRDDLAELLRGSLVTPRVGHTTFGVSDNPGRWWHARHSRHLGFIAQDSSAHFAHRLPETVEYPLEDDLTRLFQGRGSLTPAQSTRTRRKTGRQAPARSFPQCVAPFLL